MSPRPPVIPESVSIIITRVNGTTRQTKITATTKCDRLWVLGLLHDALGLIGSEEFSTLGGSAALEEAEAEEQ